LEILIIIGKLNSKRGQSNLNIMDIFSLWLSNGCDFLLVSWMLLVSWLHCSIIWVWIKFGVICYLLLMWVLLLYFITICRFYYGSYSRRGGTSLNIREMRKSYICCEGVDTHFRWGIKTKRRIRVRQLGRMWEIL